MNPRLDSLNPYPFERLATLLRDLEPNPELPLRSLAIGEPQHSPPSIVVDALRDNLYLLAKYPATKGDRALRESQAQWLEQRFNLNTIDPDSQVLPVNSTREALFAIAHAYAARCSPSHIRRRERHQNVDLNTSKHAYVLPRVLP